jgi:hypothetical protein
VLGSADYFLTAGGCLFQGKEGAEYEKIKYFLLQVEQSVGVAQLLLMDSLLDFTLSKKLKFWRNFQFRNLLRIFCWLHP